MRHCLGVNASILSSVFGILGISGLVGYRNSDLQSNIVAFHHNSCWSNWEVHTTYMTPANGRNKLHDLWNSIANKVLNCWDCHLHRQEPLCFLPMQKPHEEEFETLLSHSEENLPEGQLNTVPEWIWPNLCGCNPSLGYDKLDMTNTAWVNHVKVDNTSTG